jgi:putative hydrolase of the HAD superfamily
MSPNFFKYVDKVAFDRIEKEKINKAFSNACKYINGISMIKNKDEELKHFVQFYHILSESLPELKLSIIHIEALADDLVNNPQKYIFYEDAKTILPIVSTKYKLAIVSDAWPSLIDVYEQADYKKYFSSFIISSILGVTKPNKYMYEIALNELGITPDEAIFVDDNLNNCMGAKKVGIRPYLLCRDKKRYPALKILGIVKGYKTIYSLMELES